MYEKVKKKINVNITSNIWLSYHDAANMHMEASRPKRVQHLFAA